MCRCVRVSLSIERANGNKSVLATASIGEHGSRYGMKIQAQVKRCNGFNHFVHHYVWPDSAEVILKKMFLVDSLASAVSEGPHPTLTWFHVEEHLLGKTFGRSTIRQFYTLAMPIN